MNYNESVWAGKFGDDYTKRNIYGREELDELYINRYGASRTEMNQLFLGDLDRNARILEVGCNAGNQLALLQKMGFTNLHGVEINSDAAEIARTRVNGAIYSGISASDLSLFENNSFDLVFTSGVLIHINPNELLNVMSEVTRVSKKYVWGFEYFSPSHTEVNYRNKSDLLWRDNYAAMYGVYYGLTRVKEKFYPNIGNEELIDHMFMMKVEE
jgi:pseudaminic acid biosynthesis-associated methylase